MTSRILAGLFAVLFIMFVERRSAVTSPGPWGFLITGLIALLFVVSLLPGAAMAAPANKHFPLCSCH